jgi:hypothetical protein
VKAVRATLCGVATMALGCRSGPPPPRSCEPAAIVVQEVGDTGVVDMTVSCTGGDGPPLDAHVAFRGDALLALVGPREGDRVTGPRPARISPAGHDALGAGTVDMMLDPRTHSLRGEVRGEGPRANGHFETAYRLECRVPASVLNVQQNGVAAPGSEAFIVDRELSSTFCRRFAALR